MFYVLCFNVYVDFEFWDCSIRLFCRQKIFGNKILLSVIQSDVILQANKRCAFITLQPHPWPKSNHKNSQHCQRYSSNPLPYPCHYVVFIQCRWWTVFLAASPSILAAAIAAAEHNMKKKESGPPQIIQFLMQWERVPDSVVCNTMSPQIFRCTFHMTMTLCGICTLFCQNILRQLLKGRGTISAREREHLSQSSNLLFCWCISIQYCLYFWYCLLRGFVTVVEAINQ